MRTKHIYILFFSLCVMCIFSFSSKTKLGPIQLIEKKYKEDYQLFQKNTRGFIQVLKQENYSNTDLKEAYYKMRDAFKRIEYLWSFLDKEYVSKYINGAPLPKLEPNAPDLRIIEPKGLQRIDEELFAEEIDREQLQTLAMQLLGNLPPMPQELGMRDQQFFDASKLAVVRLAYISASGFDVPASLNPFVDMQASLGSLQFGFSQYQSLFTKQETLQIQLNEVLELLQESSEFLAKHSDFEKLDRVVLIKRFLNPLFECIVRLHKSTGFETYYEVTNQRLGVNLLSENLINQSLLDKEFFFPFPKDVDSASLVRLGKTLFYDPVLSTSVNVSCASCHKPELAFTDGLTKSVTHHGKDTVDRNAPSLLNAVYAEKYFSDLRTNNLINQIEHVVLSEKEMGSNPMEIGQKISQSSEYRIMFKSTFADENVSYQRIAVAIASYVSVLTDFNSVVDRFLLGEGSTLPSSVYQGMNIFYGKGQCATCHFGPTYAGLVPPFYSESESEVLGVPDSPDKNKSKVDTDIGRYINIKEQADIYKFSHKTSTVRNVNYTAPYMHNGVFENLEQLVDFYNDGGGSGWGFNLKHQTLGSDELNLTEFEKNNLIAFMKALKSDVSKFEAPKSLPKFDGVYSKWNKR